MADNPKLVSSGYMGFSNYAGMPSSGEACGVEGNSSSTPKISLLDHVNGFHYNAVKKSDNFVIDMDTFSHGINKDNTNNANSRTTRSLSRKGSQRGGCGAEKKSNSNANDRDATLATSSPRGPSTPEKEAVAAIGSTDIPQVHHQITITTGNIITTPESKSGFRRNSLKRSSHSWAIDPKRVKHGNDSADILHAIVEVQG